MLRAINVGSGQRPFHSTPAIKWINMDINLGWKPDVVGDWNDLGFIKTGTMDFVVSHHSLEHVGCGEGDGFIREAHRVLKPGGSLLVFMPDMKALAQRWLTRQIDDYTFAVNTYGAFMGDESDRHKWLYTFESLSDTLRKCGNWQRVQRFNWIDIPGASLARDWWILAVEAVKV